MDFLKSEIVSFTKRCVIYSYYTRYYNMNIRVTEDSEVKNDFNNKMAES